MAPENTPAVRELGQDPSGHAVYDENLLRFVGPVHRGEGATADAKAYADRYRKDHKGHKVTVQSV